VYPKANGSVGILRYLNHDGSAIAFGDIDVGDHAEIQQRNRLTLGGMISSMGLNETGLSREKIEALKKALDAIAADMKPYTEELDIGPATRRIWPSARIPYEIDSSVMNGTLKKRIADAAAIWNANGLVAIKPKGDFKPEGIAGTKVMVIGSPKNPDPFYCSSTVGYSRIKANRMILSNKCGTQHRS
jgi:hypothetical protein